MSLKNLIALQNKAKQPNANPSTPAPVDSDLGPADAASPPHDAAADEAGVESLAPDEASAPDSQVSEPAPADKPKAGLGLNLLKAGRSVGGQRPAATPTPAKQGHGSDGNSGADSGEDDGAVFGLADLAGFEATEESAPSRSALASGFEDEIEATAPERALAPDLTVQQTQFIESLDGIYPVLHDPELFGQAVRMIMLELQENPEYIKLVQDQDVHTMIRGMRNTMGLAKIRKQEKSRKTGGAAKKSARGKSSVSEDDMALLDSLLGGGGLD